MEKRFFYPKQRKLFERKMLQIIESQEPGVIIFPPNTGKSNQLISNLQKSNSAFSKFHLVTFDLAMFGVDDVAELMEILKKEIRKEMRKIIAVVIANTQTLILNKNFRLIYKMIDLHEKDNRLRFVFLANIDVTHPEVAGNIKSSIFSYIWHYPFYDKEDTLGFIDYLAKLWKVRLSLVMKSALAKNCGGYFWLIKQAFICLKDDPKLKIRNLLNYEGVRIAVEQLYTVLFKSEQEVLRRLISHHEIDTDLLKHSLHHLRNTGLVDRENNITIPVLVSYIKSNVPKIRVEVVDSRIFINDVNMDWHFSQKERRAVRILIESRHSLVSRDQLASAIWPKDTENFYTDWAVDRIIARLRTKLSELGFPRRIIETKRNKGYVFVG